MDKNSIISFAQRLVRIPSRGGRDDPGIILRAASFFADSLGISSEILKDENGPVVLVSKVEGAQPGKTWCLNACLDTAEDGNRDAWDRDPFSGEFDGRFLYGRGACDSKIAVSMFMHLFQELSARAKYMHGNLLLVLDADEHTGNFGGIKTAIAQGYKPDGLMIGYPGDDEVITGARGFSRYEITLNGVAEHSGARKDPVDNAAVRMGDLITAFQVKPEISASDEFPFVPKVTVVGAESGDGFSVVPSKAVIKIDVRLTPSFNREAADSFVAALVEDHDRKFKIPAERQSNVKNISSEPPFALSENSELRQAFRHSLALHSFTPVTEKICAPSNIGCYLTGLGIDATAGYGLPFSGLHAANEKVDLQELEKVYSVYKTVCQTLLKMDIA